MKKEYAKRGAAIVLATLIACGAMTSCDPGALKGGLGKKPGIVQQNKPGQSKPGQSKPGQSKPGQNKPGQSKPGQNKPGQNKPGKKKPEQNKAEQNKAEQNEAEQNKPVKDNAVVEKNNTGDIAKDNNKGN